MSLRHALLGFLSIRPLSGYDLKRYFDASVRHFWTADQAAIYRALGDLEAEALVRHERIAQSSRPDRKVFHLTEAGRAALDTWLATPTPSIPRREPLLVQLFFAGRIAPEALRDLLRAELAASEAELAGFRGIVAAVEAEQASLDEATQVGPLMTITNGVRAALAQRDWLRGLLERQDAGTLTVANLLDELRTLLRVVEP
jgi:DNA-binding PadR family transcriptional regulator